MKIPGKRYILFAVSLILHLAAIGLIIYFTWPIAKWYLEKLPSRGVDLYLSGSYVSYLSRYFSLPFDGWKDIWFSGVPLFKDYTLLYFYLMIPFAKHFGLIYGIQVFAVVGLFTFAAFSYLLYHELSKNRILSVILTLATVFSANYYRSLVWAGGIPFWTTQAFYPIVIFLIVKYCRSQNYRWFYLAALTAGFGILGHPQSFFNVILPTGLLIVFFWRPKELKFSFKKRLKDVFMFGILIYLIGLPTISAFSPINNLLAAPMVVLENIFSPAKRIPTSTGGTTPGGINETEIWTKAQFNLVWTDTHQLLWILLAVGFGLFLVSFILRQKRLKGLISTLPFVLTVGMIISSVFLFSRGIDFYIGGWYKALWPVIPSVAMLTAFFWGEAGFVFVEREFFQKKSLMVFRWLGLITVNLLLILVGYYLFTRPQNIISRIETLSIANSAYPDILGVKTRDEDLAELKEQIRPKLMTGDPHDYRLYTIDATVNIWWGALEDIPLTRGYVDPPLGFNERWGLFWLDSSLGPSGKGPQSSLIEDWETPEWVADNNVRFLLDWYATGYLEGNHISPNQSHLASNVTSDKFIEGEEKVETKGVIARRHYPDEYWSDEGGQSLNFYKVKEDIVSPILMSSNAPSILHIGGDDGFDSLTRFLGEVNLGPRKVILARGPKFIDDSSLSELTNFDAVILYKYDYHNYDKAWGLIGKYLERGGNVFIDTGTDVKESDTTKLPAKFPAKLPEIFPIARTVREDLGQDWDSRIGDSPAVEGVDFSEFSPLVFDKGSWNISHPINESDLREKSKVILYQKGFPVVVERKVGKGKVLWIGFNLPYHAIRDYNPQEGRFFMNLLGQLVTLKENPVLSKGSWLSPRERTIEVNGASGVVFKEQAFDGWEATFNGKGLKIYKTGPTSPGFMYVRLPKEANGVVQFSYNGAFDAKVYSLISVLTILFIFDYLLGGKVLIALCRRLLVPFRRKIGKWWEKEEEE